MAADSEINLPVCDRFDLNKIPEKRRSKAFIYQKERNEITSYQNLVIRLLSNFLKSNNYNLFLCSVKNAANLDVDKPRTDLDAE